MKIIRKPNEMTEWSLAQKKANKTIALVPTMGCLHEGHLSLIDKAKKYGDKVVISIFVNPMQFGPGEDLDSYPRQFELDCNLAGGRGADLVFAPEDGAMYGPQFQTSITVKKLSLGLCGADRPGHFDGVATVVTKLFNITGSDFAVFGEKDFQQLTVIRQLVDDLNMQVKIIPAPIVRETDGLAMSSRNKYLRDEDRKAALSLSKSIVRAKELVAAGKGILDAEHILGEVEKVIADAGAALEYAEIVDGQSMKKQETINGQSVITIAAKIAGRVRLIDNSVLI